MPRRVVLTVLVLALAFAFAPVTQAGLLAPVEDALLTREATFTEDLPTRAEDCPGGMRVGVGVRDIIPGDPLPDGGWRLWMEPFEDVDGDGVYDAFDPLEAEATFPGEPFTDENLNGKWDGPFMAGYGREKENNEYYVAEAVHDPVWARAVAITCGDTTLGLVAVDTVGLFRDFVLAVRADAEGYDHVVVASTHTHDSFDTMGLWGPSQLIDGKSPRAMAHVHARIVEALEEALAGRRAVASVTVASAHTRDVIPVAGTLQTDLRDPFVLDDKVVAARFADASGATVATVVNWAPHPETLAGTRSELSSDYAHYLRERVEARVGGTAVFFSGAVGGMMTTLGARPLYPDGTPVPDHSYEKARVIGETAAELVLDALDAAAPAAPDALRVQARAFNVPADNAFLLALNSIGVLDHSTALAVVELPGLGPTGVVAPVPFLRAETDVLTLGAGGETVLQLLTIPGELLPEIAYGNPLRADAEATMESCFAFNPDKLLFNGGREGKWDPATGARTPGFERRLASAPHYPKEPAIVTYSDARELMLLGLANDELGYIVPLDDYVFPSLAPDVYADGRDRCGDSDHYEESNSGSSLLAPAVANNLVQMLDPAFVPAPLGGEAGGLLPDGLGLWLDTSRSGGYEENEDARAVVPGVPAGVPGCYGFLNGANQDVGTEPTEDTRGFWVDLDGDCAWGAGDGAVFADMWAVSEGEPYWRPG